MTRGGRWYYQVIIGGEYGKLVQDGEDWKDSKNQSKLSVQDINEAIEKYKGANRPLRNRSQTTKLTRSRNLASNRFVASGTHKPRGASVTHSLAPAGGEGRGPN